MAAVRQRRRKMTSGSDAGTIFSSLTGVPRMTAIHSREYCQESAKHLHRPTLQTATSSRVPAYAAITPSTLRWVLMRTFTILSFAILSIGLGVTAAQAEEISFAAVESQAMKGDYQAQRNLAYGYVSWPYKGQTKNPILGCAWYLVVLHSGSTRIGPGDIGNVNVYCEKLDSNSQSVAKGQARLLFKQIYKSNPQF